MTQRTKRQQPKKVPEVKKPEPCPCKIHHNGTIDPNGNGWSAFSREDAYFISIGRSDLAPGSQFLY